jgi:hypothetical protein
MNVDHYSSILKWMASTSPFRLKYEDFMIKAVYQCFKSFIDKMLSQDYMLSDNAQLARPNSVMPYSVSVEFKLV